jgi:hypothetical protein
LNQSGSACLYFADEFACDLGGIVSALYTANGYIFFTEGEGTI